MTGAGVGERERERGVCHLKGPQPGLGCRLQEGRGVRACVCA